MASNDYADNRRLQSIEGSYPFPYLADQLTKLSERNSSLVLAFECDHIKLTLEDKGRATFETPTEVPDPRNASVSHECPGNVSVGSK